MFKKELKCLILLVFLKKLNLLECVFPYSQQTKPKNNQVHFLSDFKTLSNHLPYPIPKIKYILLKPESFKDDASFDLIMGYYHIQLSENGNNLSTIIIPWKNTSARI